MEPHIAVVGGGYWGKNLIRNFYQLGALRTICDTNPLVEAGIRNKYPDVSYSRDDEQMLADEHLRGVVLATPAALHFEMAKRALQSGKDAFVEKPLALTCRSGQLTIDWQYCRNEFRGITFLLQKGAAIPINKPEWSKTTCRMIGMRFKRRNSSLISITKSGTGDTTRAIR